MKKLFLLIFLLSLWVSGSIAQTLIVGWGGG